MDLRSLQIIKDAGYIKCSEMKRLTEENRIDTFERKIFKLILGPVNDRGQFRIRCDKTYKQYKKLPLSEYVKLQRLQCASHIAKMDDGGNPKQVLQSKWQGRICTVRPQKQWENGVMEDVRSIIIKIMN